MLNQAITELRDSWSKYLDDGLTLEPAGVVAIVAILESWAEEVAELEEIVGLVAHHHGLPDDVLKIAAMLNKNGVAVGMPDRGMQGRLNSVQELPS